MLVLGVARSLPMFAALDREHPSRRCFTARSPSRSSDASPHLVYATLHGQPGQSSQHERDEVDPELRRRSSQLGPVRVRRRYDDVCDGRDRLAITSSQTTASPKGSSSGALPAAAAARESCVSTGSIEIEPSRAIPSRRPFLSFQGRARDLSGEPGDSPWIKAPFAVSCRSADGVPSPLRRGASPPPVQPVRGRRRSSSGCSRDHARGSRSSRRSRTVPTNARPGPAGPARQ